MDAGDDIHDVKEPREAIAPEKWADFLRDFAARNNDRRARFDVFRRDGNVESEDQEAHLEDLVLKSDGAAHTVHVIRIDRAKAEAAKLTDEISNVRGINVQYDTDGSEDALEFVDNENTLISLRLESRIDGNS